MKLLNVFRNVCAVLCVLCLSTLASAVEPPAGYVANRAYASVESDVAPAIKPEYSARRLGTAYVGVHFTYFLGTFEGESPISFAGNNVGIVGKCNYYADSLPDGLYINTKRGFIYGVPTTAGYYKFTVTASNSHGSATFTADITIKECITGYEGFQGKRFITTNESTCQYAPVSYNIYYGNTFIVPNDVVEVNGTNWSKYIIRGDEYPTGPNSFWTDSENGSNIGTYIIATEDMEGEWDFGNDTTGDTGTTEIVKSSETPVMAFAATQEVTSDTAEVVTELEVTAPASAVPSVADVLRGTVTEFDYDLYVMIEIGDDVLFVTEEELTGNTKEFTKKIKSGKHRIFTMQMNPVFRLALKGVKVNWYAGCINTDMELKGQIATATTEFK